jgi:resuscitation-promoting factor RpfB
MSDEMGTPPPTYPAGWYPSHSAPGRQEYWDGARWTGVYGTEPTGTAVIETAVATAPAVDAPAVGAPTRRIGVSTWIGIGLVALWLIVSFASSGVPAILVNGGVIALVTALYVVITGRSSWMHIKSRKVGALLVGAALVATFTGAAIAPRQPDTDIVALADSSETMVPQSTPGSASSATAPAPKPTPTAKRPLVVTERVTELQAVDFPVTTVDDSSLAAGTTQVVTPGQAGTRTVVYEVTYTDGVETGRVVVTDTITVQPVPQLVANGTYVEPAPVVAAPPAGGGCDSNYDPCVPVASDVDCAGGSGNGPAYVSGPVYVIGSDVYDLDRDGDGIACD